MTAGSVRPAATLADYHAVVAARYGADPTFVYPDIGFLSRIAAGRSAYFDRGRANTLALDRGGVPVAFGVSFVDPGLQDKVGSPVGSIGFFESIDHQAGAELLRGAEEWLRSHGVTEVWAPFNANPYYRMGFRENRFDEPPFVGCAHDPPGTSDLLERSGYQPLMRYLNFDIPLAALPPEPPVPAGITFRAMSRRRFRDDVLAFVRLHNLAFQSVWGEVEISDAEALELLLRSRLALDPQLFQFAESDGEPVGFVLCVANLGEALAPLHHPLTSPRGLVRLARRRRNATAVGLLALAVHPDHQARGIGTALVHRACRATVRRGYRRLEYALVAEANQPSRATAARFGGVECRSFGIYTKPLP